MIKISSESDDQTYLLFRLEGDVQILASAPFNLIEEVFSKLQSLYFQQTISLSEQYCIGLLVGCNESSDSCLGVTLPLSTLNYIYEQLSQPRVLLAYLNICKMFYVGMDIQVNGEGIAEHSKSVDVPSSSIWAMIALSEILGSRVIFQECIKKLQKMFILTQTDQIPCLPESVLKCFPLNEKDTIQTSLWKYLQVFGNRTQNEEVSQMKSSLENSLADFQSHDNNIEGTPYHYEGKHSYNSAFMSNDRSIHQKEGHSDDPRDQALQQSQYANAREEQSESFYERYQRSRRERQLQIQMRNHHFNGSNPSSVNVSVSESSVSGGGSLRSGQSSKSSGLRSVQTDVGYDSDALDTIDESISEQNLSTSMHHRQLSTTSHQHSFVGGRGGGREAGGNDLRSSSASMSFTRSNSPAPFGSVTPRFHTPFQDASVVARLPVTPTPRFPRRQAAQDSGTSPTTDYEYDSDHYNNNNSSSSGGSKNSRKPKLSAEALEVSRDLARLRIKELKVIEEIEASKRRSEREMQEARLRSLQLTAAVARATGRSPHRLPGDRSSKNESELLANTRLNSSSANTPTRNNANIGASRSNKIDNTGRSETSGTTQGTLSHQKFIAVEAQRRAAQRVRESRRRQEQRERAEQSLEKAKKDQVWANRDRQLELFKQKQNGRLGEDIPINPGVSSRWLNGRSDDPTPLHVTKSMRGLPVATTHTVVTKYRYGVPHEVEPYSPLDAEEEQHGSGIVQRGLYSADALEAVGLGFSPGSKLNPHHSSQMTTTATASLPSSPTSPASVHTAVDLVSLRIIKAWDLSEALGGTNAYVMIDWGKYGKSQTQAVPGTTEPHFGATLQFKSPYARLNPSEVEVARADPTMAVLRSARTGAEYISFAGPMKVCVFNRNESVSHDLLAHGEIDTHECILAGAGQSLVLHLRDECMQPAGCLEFNIRYTPQQE